QFGVGGVRARPHRASGWMQVQMGSASMPTNLAGGDFGRERLSVGSSGDAHRAVRWASMPQGRRGKTMRSRLGRALGALRLGGGTRGRRMRPAALAIAPIVVGCTLLVSLVAGPGVLLGPRAAHASGTATDILFVHGFDEDLPLGMDCDGGGDVA